MLVFLWLVVPGPWPITGGLAPRVFAHYFWGVESTLYRPAPDQPLAFSHVTHAGALEINCAFCHRTVEKEETASVPAVEQCIFCHKIISGTGDAAVAEVQKLRDAFQEEKPLNWVRVHRLPDHVQFVHEPHIRFFAQQDPAAPLEATCATCHGDVKTMTKVKQVRSLKMGDCVNCHKDYNAPTDCAACHY